MYEDKRLRIGGCRQEGGKNFHISVFRICLDCEKHTWTLAYVFCLQDQTYENMPLAKKKKKSLKSIQIIQYCLWFRECINTFARPVKLLLIIIIDIKGINSESNVFVQILVDHGLTKDSSWGDPVQHKELLKGEQCGRTRDGGLGVFLWGFFSLFVSSSEEMDVM